MVGVTSQANTERQRPAFVIVIAIFYQSGEGLTLGGAAIPESATDSAHIDLAVRGTTNATSARGVACLGVPHDCLVFVRMPVQHVRNLVGIHIEA